MYQLTAEHSMDSAHFLADYHGKCGNIHGHRWRVLITIMGEQLETTGKNRGMIVDFGQLKEDLKAAVDFYDHSLIIEKNSIKEETLKMLLSEGFCIHQVDYRPTAENFAAYFYHELKKKGYWVKEAVVYETPNNCAVYSEEC